MTAKIIPFNPRKPKSNWIPISIALVLLFAVILGGCEAKAQRVSYQFVHTGATVTGRSKIIKDTICADCVYDYKKGNIPTRYHWVRTEYFDPPGDFQIIKWLFTEFPKTYNGWAIDLEDDWKFMGDTNGFLSYKVNLTCDTCDYLQKYTNDISISYGYGDKTTITVTQNKDTTDKYFKLQHLIKPIK